VHEVAITAPRRQLALLPLNIMRNQFRSRCHREQEINERQTFRSMEKSPACEPHLKLARRAFRMPRHGRGIIVNLTDKSRQIRQRVLDVEK
jgi:hypothetical protein